MVIRPRHCNVMGPVPFHLRWHLAGEQRLQLWWLRSTETASQYNPNDDGIDTAMAVPQPVNARDPRRAPGLLRYDRSDGDVAGLHLAPGESGGDPR
jgi:hypothetical protein